MKINIYTMLKTLNFTIQNGRSISNAMKLLSKSAKTRKERKIYIKIYDDIKDGYSLSQALSKHKIGSLDTIQFISMAEKGVSFRIALEKIIHYLEVKDEFERQANDKTSLPTIYFSVATLVVLGVKFIAVPYQMAKADEYNQIVKDLVANHLYIAQIMTDILFFSLLFFAAYFAVLLISLFSQSRAMQNLSKQIALMLPLSSTIVMKFEKFMLFSMLGEMLQSGISYKNVITSAIETTTVKKFKKALQSTLNNIKYNGKLTLHSSLYDNIEKELLTGVGSSHQIGKVMIEISDRARTDALRLSTKFFRIVTLVSIFLLSFAVFIEFYTIILTQIIIQKGMIDAARTGAFN